MVEQMVSTGICSPENAVKSNIAIVTTARDERPFLDEWLIYHHIIGADHFFLYDDEPNLPLKEFCSPHQDYVTVIPFFEQCEEWPGSCKQNKAYTHALEHFLSNYEWVAFIDIDEFVVLEQHENIMEFLASLPENTSAVSLRWRLFGHNGFFEDPKRLITASLVRRKLKTDPRVKTITRYNSITGFTTPHYPDLGQGTRIEIDDRVAHINHYQCRSFERHMNRVKRGDCVFTSKENENQKIPKSLRWKMSRRNCLKYFVNHVALDHNEYVDKYMLKYQPSIEATIKKLGRT